MCVSVCVCVQSGTSLATIRNENEWDDMMAECIRMVTDYCWIGLKYVYETMCDGVALKQGTKRVHYGTYTHWGSLRGHGYKYTLCSNMGAASACLCHDVRLQR